MAKKYDVIVVGAGLAGFLAARAAGENGLEVALLERKADPAQLTRACTQILVSMNGYYFGDIVGYNARDKRILFPVYGFSFKYDGPYQNLYGSQMYTPNGHKIQRGNLEEQRKKGDHGRNAIVFDKEILLRCLLEEVKACRVDVFPGINVQKATATADGIRVEGSGQSFDGSYVIAADGANSPVAEAMGFNKDRYYYFNLYSLGWYMSGVEPPEHNVLISTHGFPQGIGAQFFVVPRAAKGEYIVLALAIDPGLDLKAAGDYFMKEAFCAPWFKNAKKLRAFSAVNNLYSPITEAYRDRVLVAGDAGGTMEIENTGAMISGWKAGQAVSTTIQEGNLGLEVTALSQYANWWKETYIDCYHPEEIACKFFAVPYTLTTDEDINYVFGFIRETLPPPTNPFAPGLSEALERVVPIMQQERPEVLQKLRRTRLPAREIFAEVTKISKPVSYQG